MLPCGPRCEWLDPTNGGALGAQEVHAVNDRANDPTLNAGSAGRMGGSSSLLDEPSEAGPDLECEGPRHTQLNPWAEVVRCLGEYDRWGGEAMAWLAAQGWRPDMPEYVAARAAERCAAVELIGWVRVIQDDIRCGVVR